ncbi:hypothetical protein C1C34_23025 [Salmonella enterica subsp. enterica]|nr:hypothetical protein [Salmonella enterica subsp. enterica]EDM1743979.1 hypothetical protein [Salmonella enterica subsp. enterica serovar Muenchen]
MDYNSITSAVESHIICILSDSVYTEQQRYDFAYGAYLVWHALVKGVFCKEDDARLWSLVRYTKRTK